MSIREELENWDATFFNKEKSTNKFVGYAISRGMLSTSLLGIILSAKAAIEAVTVLPPKDEAMNVGGAFVCAAIMVGLTALRLVAGRQERRNRSPSLQPK